MPYTPDHKQQTRERIVGAAARLFNRKGFAEVTIGVGGCGPRRTDIERGRGWSHFWGARLVKAFNTPTPAVLGSEPREGGGRRVIL